MEWGKMVECSILVELAVCEGFTQKLVVHGEKGNYSKNEQYHIVGRGSYIGE